MKLKFDWPALKAAVRTTGALMLGNAFVAVLLLDTTNWRGVVWLTLAAMALILVTLIEQKE